MVDMESSEEFENNPFVILLLFSLFNKNVYFILKFEIGSIYNQAIYSLQSFDIILKQTTSNQFAKGIYNKGFC